MTTQKLLIALDFDHTLIDENSDLYVVKLAPDKKLPKEIQDCYSNNGWTDYMARIFQYLHDHGISREDFKKCLSNIPLTLGMKDLFAFIRSSDKIETVIISDANSVFIEMILDQFGLKDVVNCVFTNPAVFDEKGCLRLHNYHTQDWCSLSTVNLCKGHILQEHIKKKMETGIHFSPVLYIGDGSNDLCPGLSLTSSDYLCPRVGFSLWKKVNALIKDQSKDGLKAKLYPWESGSDILGLIKDISGC